MTENRPEQDQPSYEKPGIADYGTLAALTAGTAFRGPEDGGTKVEPLPHHSLPS